MPAPEHDPDHHAAGHAEHFLARLDRLDDPHVALSLSLYRDHELVRDLLGYLNVPEGTARVALALDATESPPYVLVTHDGHFVTALAKGMRPTGCYVVARSRLDALTERTQLLRERIALNRKREAERGKRYLLRIKNAGPNLTREDYESVEPLVRLMPHEYWPTLINVSVNVLRAIPRLSGIERPRGPQVSAIRGFHDDLYLLAHLALLCTEPETREAFEIIPDAERHRFHALAPLIDTQHPGLALRALAAAARIGKPLLASMKRKYATASTLREHYRGMFTLLAIGSRHRKLQAEIAKVLSSAGDVSTPLHDYRDERVEHFRGMCENVFDGAPSDAKALLQGYALDRLRATFGGQPEHLQPDYDTLPGDVLLGCGVCWHPRHPDPLERMADVIAMLPWAANADATEFYLPDAARLIPQPYEEEDTLALLGALHYERPGPARVEKKPGRNDPCTCGSGKKYKKCHGA